MSLAPWRSPLARALHLNRSLVYSRYFQLATIDNNGYPANRTVVFRGFLGETNQLKIITDSRSQKASQIPDYPQGEICWYFPRSREQFRFRGTLTLVTTSVPGITPELQSARKQMWQEISPAARRQFLWATPGEPLQRNIESVESNDLTSDLTPAPTFCLLLFIPIKVDHLQLRDEPQSRHSYTWDGSTWAVTAINP